MANTAINDLMAWIKIQLLSAVLKYGDDNGIDCDRIYAIAWMAGTGTKLR